MHPQHSLPDSRVQRCRVWGFLVVLWYDMSIIKRWGTQYLLDQSYCCLIVAPTN
jgi:hypothetical protein